MSEKFQLDEEGLERALKSIRPRYTVPENKTPEKSKTPEKPQVPDLSKPINKTGYIERITPDGSLENGSAEIEQIYRAMPSEDRKKSLAALTKRLSELQADAAKGFGDRAAAGENAKVIEDHEKRISILNKIGFAGSRQF